MIHKVKSLYEKGRGLSERELAKKLGISRNTVRKYINMNEEDIQQAMAGDASRQKRLDDYRDSIIRLLQTFPRMSAVKVLRKLKEKLPELSVSDRSMRRYIGELKASGEVSERIRRYEPVVDMLPGKQCQVDGGELRKVLIGGVERTVYFLVFVLSCSRLMHVSTSLRPIDSELNIRMHDAAFRSFGGMPEECVYDQTKLVVIHEQYRELELNNRFAQYATTAGFRIHCCRGYDPESKGKVEAGVKYVKENCLYGECFADEAALEQHIACWLETVANVRTHGTTHHQPAMHYQSEELAHMKPYLTSVMPEIAAELVRRKVDKTGLISWSGNRYSVPMQYQRGEVYGREHAGELLIHDVAGERVATWAPGKGKGKVFKNCNHYRDPAEQISELEAEVLTILGKNNGAKICQRIRQAKPKIYKDQLRGLCRELKRLGAIEPPIMARLLDREAMSVRQLVEAVEAWRAHPQRLQEEAPAQGNPAALLAYGEVASHAVH
ncbi:MAG: IS21 family transposase [Mariprofundus sp.]|nr:IS21 family transposase [Mariprofundus sp.]